MAAYSEITIEQNASYSTTINVEDIQGNPLNLYGYSVASQIRKSYYSLTSVSFDSSVSDYSNGEILLSITSSNTANMQPGRYVYDVIITSDSDETTRVVEGIATVIPGVTRNA